LRHAWCECLWRGWCIFGCWSKWASLLLLLLLLLMIRRRFGCWWPRVANCLWGTWTTWSRTAIDAAWSASHTGNQLGMVRPLGGCWVTLGVTLVWRITSGSKRVSLLQRRVMVALILVVIASRSGRSVNIWTKYWKSYW
jgi:hypothetical protein